jgi:ribonuclease HI
MTQKIDKIIYADGSSLGNPGRGGWGVLIIDNLENKKVELGGGEENTTNNKMELQALIEVLKFLTKVEQPSPKFAKEEQGKFFLSKGEDLEQIISKEKISKTKNVELRLDSEYVIKGATIWSKSWEKNNWKKSDKKPVLNQEYWKEILLLLKEIELQKKVKLNWKHVYGHTGEEGNERVDVIAKSFASGKPVSLKKEF